jgi:hypothetical protein
MKKLDSWFAPVLAVSYSQDDAGRTITTTLKATREVTTTLSTQPARVNVVTLVRKENFDAAMNEEGSYD